MERHRKEVVARHTDTARHPKKTKKPRQDPKQKHDTENNNNKFGFVFNK